MKHLKLYEGFEYLIEKSIGSENIRAKHYTDIEIIEKHYRGKWLI